MSTHKKVRSENYNYTFRYSDGLFVRWGKTLKDDPEWSPVGPEILDIEISTICSKGCSWCYKSNTSQGKWMSFETFKNIIDKMRGNLCQVAFGIGDIDANPDMWRMFEYCRSINIVPNLTINGENLDETHCRNFARLCGSVAVSHYDTATCGRAVSMLASAGVGQVNIHQLVACETHHQIIALIDSIKVDSHFSELNALVLLGLKQKGRRNRFTRMSDENFKQIVDTALEKDVRLGFDSCSAYKFLEAIKDRKLYNLVNVMVEPCESGLFSSYINVDGFYFPCSFMEEEVNGIDVVAANNFIDDVWNHETTIRWRETLIKTKDEVHKCRRCPVFKI